MSASTETPAIVQTSETAPPADPLAALSAELESTRTTLAGIRRERDVHRALFEAGANDLDIGAAMIERDATGAPGRPVPELVADLKRRKPQLFGRAHGTPANPPAPAGPSRPSGSMSARPSTEDPKQSAAQRAASTGDRASLMTYLRLRRQPA